MVQRNDDKPDVVLARLKNYHYQNLPVVDYYRYFLLFYSFFYSLELLKSDLTSML